MKRIMVIAIIAMGFISCKEVKNEEVKVEEKSLIRTQQLALDLLNEFEDSINNEYKEEGIEMSIVYNGIEYTTVDSFKRDIK